MNTDEKLDTIIALLRELVEQAHLANLPPDDRRLAEANRQAAARWQGAQALRSAVARMGAAADSLRLQVPLT